MEDSNDKAFTALLLELQQQFLWYEEKSSKRFQVLEELLEEAAHKMEELKKLKAKRKAARIVNPFAKTEPIIREPVKPLQHLKLTFPSFKEGDDVTSWIQDCEQYFSVFQIGENKKTAIAGMHLTGIARRWFEVYIIGRENHSWHEFQVAFIARFGSWNQEQLIDNFDMEDSVYHLEEPVYDDDEESLQDCEHHWVVEHHWAVERLHDEEPVFDEEPGESQERWPEQEFISAALRGNNLHSSNPLQSDFGTCESQNQPKPKLDDYREEEIGNYQESPKYDEIPGEDKDDWHSKEIILTLLGLEDSSQQNQNLKEGSSCGAKMWECASDSRRKPSEIRHFYKEDLHGCQECCPEQESLSLALGGVGKQRVIKKVTPMILPNMRAIIEVFPSQMTIKDFPTVDNSYSLSKESSNVLCIFDPGGQVQNDLLYTQVIHDVKIYSPSQKMTPKLGDGLDIGLCSYCPAFDGFQHLCNQVCLSIMSKEDATKCLNYNQSKDVPCRKNPAAANYSGLEKKSSHLDKKIMIIFDPDQQKDHSKGVDNMMFQDMIRSEVKLEAAAMIISAVGQLRELKSLAIDQEKPLLRRKLKLVQSVPLPKIQGHNILEVNDEKDQVVNEINEQYIDSMRAGMVARPYRYTVLRQGSPGKVMRFEEALRIKYTITIFDPGGDLSVFMLLNLLVMGFYMLNNCCQMFYKGKELALSDIQMEGSCQIRINHEDMVIFKGGRSVRN